MQGAIINFEMLTPEGSVLSYKTFERDAATAGFHVRAGRGNERAQRVRVYRYWLPPLVWPDELR